MFPHAATSEVSDVSASMSRVGSLWLQKTIITPPLIKQQDAKPVPGFPHHHLWVQRVEDDGRDVGETSADRLDDDTI